MTKSKWPPNAKELSIRLHDKLSLDHHNWHQLKGNPNRRAAELLSGALIQLLSDGNISEIESLIEQSMRWLKKEVKAPACPNQQQ